jgi:hypothetical protein
MVGTAMDGGGIDARMDNGEENDGNGDHANKGLILERGQWKEREGLDLPAIEDHELNLLSHHVSTNAPSQLGNTEAVSQGCLDSLMG